MKRSLAAAVALLLLAPAAAPAATVPANAKKFERTLPFREGSQKLDIRLDDVTIDSVEIKNWPDADDFRKSEKDPNDTKTMWVVFTYTNKTASKYICRYAVTILDPDGGKPWAEDDATRDLDKGQVADTNRFGMKMKTRLYGLAKKMKLSFEVWKK